MDGKIVILGYGPVGKAAAELLAKAGKPVVVAQRSAPARGCSRPCASRPRCWTASA